MKSLVFSSGISQISSFPGNNGSANKITVTRDWLLAKSVVLCGRKNHDNQFSFIALDDELTLEVFFLLLLAAIRLSPTRVIKGNFRSHVISLLL